MKRLFSMIICLNLCLFSKPFEILPLSRETCLSILCRGIPRYKLFFENCTNNFTAFASVFLEIGEAMWLPKDL